MCKITFVVLQSFPQEPMKLEYKDIKEILKKHFVPITIFLNRRMYVSSKKADKRRKYLNFWQH